MVGSLEILGSFMRVDGPLLSTNSWWFPRWVDGLNNVGRTGLWQHATHKSPRRVIDGSEYIVVYPCHQTDKYGSL